MRVIGVDPGIVVTGFGIIDINNNNLTAHSYGTAVSYTHLRAHET